MLTYLPISSLRDEDIPEIGRELVNLGKLKQIGLCNIEGLIILPPSDEISFPKVQIPADLNKLLLKNKFKPSKLWRSLLQKWQDELNLQKKLSAIPLIFTKQIKTSGKSYFDGIEKEVVIKLDFGNLTPKQTQEVKELVKAANKKLFISQIYHFIFDRDSKLIVVRLSPFTHLVEENEQAFSFGNERKNLSMISTTGKFSKSATKLFSKLKDEFVIDKDLDGVIVEGNNLDSDKTILQLVETSLALPEGHIIFKPILDSLDNNFKKNLEVLDFVRNKKSLLNIEVYLPKIRSIEEFNHFLKKALMITKINKDIIWQELSIPENFINLNSYLKSGIRKVVIDLDYLYKCLSGFDLSADEQHNIENTKLLISFLKEPLRLLNKEKIKVLVQGRLTDNTEIIEFFISRGVYGLISDIKQASSTYNHLRFVEKRILRKLA